MRKIADRLSKLEAEHAPASQAVRTERHIVTGADEAERQAKIEALTTSSPNNVLHIIRTIVRPNHEGPSPCPA